jgi:hypothetical protein
MRDKCIEYMDYKSERIAIRGSEDGRTLCYNPIGPDQTIILPWLPKNCWSPI